MQRAPASPGQDQAQWGQGAFWGLQGMNPAEGLMGTDQARSWAAELKSPAPPSRHGQETGESRGGDDTTQVRAGLRAAQQ